MRNRYQTRNHTRKSRGRKRFQSLNVLVNVLNAESEEQLDDQLGSQSYSCGRIKDFWMAREEIAEDLRFVTGFRTKRKTQDGLKRIIRKVNSLGLVTVWASLPVQPTLRLLHRRKVSAEFKNPGWEKFGPGQGTLEIADMKFLVFMDFNYRDGREFLYALIAFSLQDGELRRLNQCGWEKCRKIFLTDQSHRSYCSARCAAAYECQQAPKRVQKWRHKQAT